ncbi:MAG: DMT family transporter [Gammaproteobacteria bacterium]
MKIADVARLLLLAAIWGGSFLFTRISAPVLGPVILIESRVGLAVLLLLSVARFVRKPLHAREHWQHYLILGVVNTAIPFLLYAFAAQTLTASEMAVLNASSPIWGALIGVVWKGHNVSPRMILGLVLGVLGVGLVVGLDRFSTQAGAPLAISAALLASFCYGIATNYARTAKSVDSFSNAHGSMWAATLVLAPFVPFASVRYTPDTEVVLSVLAVGILCTGVALLLYFRLIRDVGATSALTVTFLVPVFGILWGHLFLHEALTAGMLIGTGVVLIGTALVTGFNPFSMLKQR